VAELREAIERQGLDMNITALVIEVLDSSTLH